MKNILVIVIILVLVGAFLGRHQLKTMLMGSPAPATQTGMQPTTTAAPEAMSGASGATVAAGAAKEFTVTGTEFAFAPNTLTVGAGDTVKVTFTNNGTYPHNFTIDALNVKGKTIQPGQSDTVTFTATKAGTYQYYCSVPGHKDKGMVGTLKVQ
ncbi:MAG TPA: cupredoxin domain-containing protein [Patescibacteria group bacterium]|nr:cupredoxin domain-containing protein [Patescibacteria group bacterium]